MASNIEINFRISNIKIKKQIRTKAWNTLPNDIRASATISIDLQDSTENTSFQSLL